MAPIGRNTDGLPLTVPMHVRLPLSGLLPAPLEPTTVRVSRRMKCYYVNAGTILRYEPQA